ncbi:hypothetical protein [Microcystis sp. T1-4]|uniref:hypothetical protein n=1 Tax=Microcystis sp. T1-4 TaxID=1160279 RepID=UPI0002623009|nr:hypothetical protein [Microcystis sp. T1-4]CCI32212.1 hypothetical protein MICAI_2410003 [Microcystis sp. T1-4]
MLKKTIKKLSRSLGIDLKKYNLQTSETVRMQRLLAYHNIDLVFDVGANIGQYTKLLRELGYSGRIVSFEPLPTESELTEQERMRAQQERMRAEDLQALLQSYRERFGDLPE